MSEEEKGSLHDLDVRALWFLASYNYQPKAIALVAAGMEVTIENLTQKVNEKQGLLNVATETMYRMEAENRELKTRLDKLTVSHNELQNFRDTVNSILTENLTEEAWGKPLAEVILNLVTLAKKQDQVCYWTPDQGYDYIAYDSSCGKSWVFEEGGPTENDMNYCPFCGKKLVPELPAQDGPP